MSLPNAARLFELGLVAAGWLLVWRLQLSAAARKTKPLLPVWQASGTSFTMATLCVATGWVAASIAWGYLLKLFPGIRSDQGLSMVVGGTVSHLGILIGLGAGWYLLREAAPAPDQPTAAGPDALPAPGEKKQPVGLWVAAVATAVITIAVVTPVQLAWEALLTRLNLPTSKQELVTLFAHSDSPTLTILLIISAVVIAPVVEELVFRAGLFRFLRARVPHWLALLLPALFFAALHVNRDTLEGLITLAPLTAFGIVFSIAYERTGRIAVVMLAHGLFNLHTVVFLLLGLTD